MRDSADESGASTPVNRPLWLFMAAWPTMRPGRDAMRVARHFSAGVMDDRFVASPVGTTESDSIYQFVPTGLVLRALVHHGTEVPCYFHRVPPGRQLAKLQRADLQSVRVVRRGTPHQAGPDA